MSSEDVQIDVKGKIITDILVRIAGSTYNNASYLRICLKHLVEFCQLVVKKKKGLNNGQKRRILSKSISTIKKLSPLLSQYVNSPDDHLSIANISTDDCINGIKMAIHNVMMTSDNLIPDPLSDLFDNEDTLYFDFKLTSIDDEPVTVQRSTYPTHQSHIPRLSVENKVLERINESSELIESAQDLIIKFQKISRNSSRQDKEMMRSLRRKINQAIIEYDASTTNLLNGMEDKVLKKQLNKDMKHLIDLINEMKSFLQMQRSNKAAVKEFDPRHKPTEVQLQLPRVVFNNDRQSKDSTKQDHVQSSFDINANLTGPLINVRSLACKGEMILSSVKQKDSRVFEKEINSITELQDCMRILTSDLVKRSGANSNIAELSEKANNSSRQLIRHARDMYDHDHSMQNEIDSIRVLTEDWSTKQVAFLDIVTHHLQPWMKFATRMFSFDDGHTDVRRRSLILNKAMTKFKEIDNELNQLARECITETSENAEYNDKNIHLVKLKNLPMELREYSNKVLQLAKLHFLGDVDVNEWSSFGLWIYRWANCVKQLVYHTSCLTDTYNEEKKSAPVKQLRLKHEKLKIITEHTIESCQDSEYKKMLNVSLVELNEICNELSQAKQLGSNDVLSDVQVELLSIKWSIKAYVISQLLTEVTRYLSKPINRLLEVSSVNQYESIFMSKMERIRIHTCLAVDQSTSRHQVHTIIETLDQLDDVAEEIISTCRRIKGNNPTIPIDSTLNMLRLQWVSSSDHLLYLLRQLPEVRYSAISAMMRHYLSAEDLSNPNEFLDVLSEDVKSSISIIPESSSSSLLSDHDSMYDTWADYSENSELVNDATLLNTNDSFNQQTDSGYLNPKQMKHGPDELENSRLSVIRPKPPVSPKPKRVQPKTISTADVPPKLKPSSYDSSPVLTTSQPTSKSIAAAAHVLQHEADQWEDENNSIIKVVKLMANQMFQMAEFSKGRGNLRSKDDLVLTAKAIAANAKTVAKFASIIAEQCQDESCRNDLLHYVELVPTISTQLRIVSSVKSVTTEDQTADVMLVTNAENLMKAVVGALKASEAACVKSSPSQTQHSEHLHDSQQIAFQWKRKVRLKRAMNALSSPRDDLGLRLSRDNNLPSLTDLLL